MTIHRRSFLSNLALGAGVIAAAPFAACSGSKEESKLAYIKVAASRNPSMNFNMCGYAAPKLETVRVGFVGIGDRGSGAVKRMTYIEGVEVTALCDIRQAAVYPSD